MSEEIKEFGQWLKSLRTERRLTLDELGEMIGYSNPYLSQIENGKKKYMPSPEFLKKLSTALDVPFESLMIKAGHIDHSLSNRAALLDPKTKDYLALIANTTDPEERNKILEEYHTYQSMHPSVIEQNDLRNMIQTARVYAGKPLSQEDRKRILDMLKLLFPER